MISSGNPEVHYKPSLIYPYTSQVKLNSLIEDSRVKFMEKYNLKIPASNGTGLQKYKVLRTLGSGAFGSVFLVKDKSKEASECLALKMQPKERIIKTKQIKHLLSEKAVLAAANFPFIMNMIEAFKDTTYVYFLLPFVNGGDMYTHLKAVGNFSEVVSSFFGSQVLLALEYLHRCNIIYRDLKPENILLDYQGYIKIIDFGFTKFITGRTYSFCGTPEYIAPEIILNKGYGFSTDWWSFGVLIYELTKGKSPFYAREDMEMYENIVRCKYKMPKEFTKDLADLIDKLLQVDISKRFGNLKQGIKDIKTHRWFRHISFGRIYLRSIDPPYKPSVKGPCDTQNFHRHSTDMDMKAPGENDLYSAEFADF